MDFTFQNTQGELKYRIHFKQANPKKMTKQPLFPTLFQQSFPWGWRKCFLRMNVIEVVSKKNIPIELSGIYWDFSQNLLKSCKTFRTNHFFKCIFNYNYSQATCLDTIWKVHTKTLWIQLLSNLNLLVLALVWEQPCVNTTSLNTNLCVVMVHSVSHLCSFTEPPEWR